MRRVLLQQPELVHSGVVFRPLHDAITAEVAELLIEFGADVNAEDFHGNKPLSCARTESIARIMVAAGAGVDVDALSGAVSNDRLDVARYLISQGLLISGNRDLISNVKSEPM